MDAFGAVLYDLPEKDTVNLSFKHTQYTQNLFPLAEQNTVCAVAF